MPRFGNRHVSPIAEVQRQALIVGVLPVEARRPEVAEPYQIGVGGLERQPRPQLRRIVQPVAAADAQVHAAAVHRAVGLRKDCRGLPLKDADGARVHVPVHTDVKTDPEIEAEARLGLRAGVTCAGEEGKDHDRTAHKWSTTIHEKHSKGSSGFLTLSGCAPAALATARRRILSVLSITTRQRRGLWAFGANSPRPHRQAGHSRPRPEHRSAAETGAFPDCAGSAADPPLRPTFFVRRAEIIQIRSAFPRLSHDEACRLLNPMCTSAEGNGIGTQLKMRHQSIADAIERYLLRHPAAADSEVGIAEWWLVEQGIRGVGRGRARGAQAAGESGRDGTRDPARRTAPVAADATLAGRVNAGEPSATWPTSLPSTRLATRSSPTCATRIRGRWPASTCPTARSISSRRASSPASRATRPASRSTCTGSRSTSTAGSAQRGSARPRGRCRSAWTCTS